MMSTSRAVVTINTPSDRDQIARWAQNVDWGTVVEFKKKTRSTEQNAKMHAMLAEVSDQVVWYGRKLSVEDWKNVFSASLRKAQVVPGIDPGTVVPLGIHTSTMTIDEMSNMIELIYAFGADPEHLVNFREPNTEASDAPPPDAPDVSDEAPPQAPTPSLNEPAGETPPDSPAGSSPEAWLLNVARMLWAVAIPGGDTDTLRNQRKAAQIEFPKPEGCPERLAGKANSVFERCREVIERSLEKGDALTLVAGIVGVDQDDILERAQK